MEVDRNRVDWYALVVRARQEWRIAEALRAKSYETFLPIDLTYQPRGHHKLHPHALFPGYVFCSFDPAIRMPVLLTEGVLTVVSYDGQPAAVDPAQIDALRRASMERTPMTAIPYIEAGDRVRITRGALRGVEGILLEVRGRSRLIVSITLLRRSVALEVSASAVEPVALSPQKAQPPGAWARGA